MCCGAGTDCVRSRWTRITVIAGTRRAVARAHAVRWRICGAGVPSFRGVAAERRVAGAGEHIDVGIPVGAGVEDAVGGGLVRMRPVLLELGAVEVDVLAAWWGSRGSSPDEPSQVEHRIRRASHPHRLAWFTCPVGYMLGAVNLRFLRRVNTPKFRGDFKPERFLISPNPDMPHARTAPGQVTPRGEKGAVRRAPWTLPPQDSTLQHRAVTRPAGCR